MKMLPAPRWLLYMEVQELCHCWFCWCFVLLLQQCKQHEILFIKENLDTLPPPLQIIFFED